MAVRAKVQVNEITRHLGSVYNAETEKYESGEVQTVKMTAVHGGSTNAEDNTYAAASPSATFTISITNPAAVGQFELGKKYYADFTPAE